MAVIVGVVSSVVRWCAWMRPPARPPAIATMWGRESEKVGEGQREAGIETMGIKSGGGWFGVRVALIVTIVEIVTRGEVIVYFFFGDKRDIMALATLVHT